MKLTLTQIQATIIELLEALIKEWNVHGLSVTDSTFLSADLGLSSLDALQLMANLDARLGTKLPYDRLLAENSETVMDISVAQLAQFVNKCLA